MNHEEILNRNSGRDTAQRLSRWIHSLASLIVDDKERTRDENSNEMDDDEFLLGVQSEIESHCTSIISVQNHRELLDDREARPPPPSPPRSRPSYFDEN